VGNVTFLSSYLKLHQVDVQVSFTNKELQVVHLLLQYCGNWGYMLIGTTCAGPCFVLPLFIQSKVAGRPYG